MILRVCIQTCACLATEEVGEGSPGEVHSASVVRGRTPKRKKNIKMQKLAKNIEDKSSPSVAEIPHKCKEFSQHRTDEI